MGGCARPPTRQASPVGVDSRGVATRSLGFAFTLLLGLGGCAGVGTEPIAGQPPHHVEGGFRNPWSDYRRPGTWTRLSFLAAHSWRLLTSPRRFEAPRETAEALAAARTLSQGNPRATVTWVGHATVLVHVDGVNLLTDPHWGDRASPLSWAGPRRLSPPGVPFESLPPIHVVVISHDHYDHLDVATVKRLAATHDPLFLVPLGFGPWFAEQGIVRVQELDWWQEHQIGGVRVVCAPAQHWGQRSPFDLNRRLWASWAVLGPSGRRLYFSGDTGYFEGFREIGGRLGPFHVAALAIGGYLPPALMRPHHVNPEEAVQAFVDLRAQVMLGVHWGTFDLTHEALDEPPRRMLAELERRQLDRERGWVLRMGETRRW
jgi:N-acyl-phosphatidylethanolamine-hydrolysing phospholipase D